MIPPINLSNYQNGARLGFTKLYSPASALSTTFPPISGTGTSLLGSQRLWPGEIHQHHIRALLHSFEYNFMSVRRDVEVTNVEVRSEVGQLPLGAGLQVHEPKILMLNLSLQKQECPSPR